MATNDTTMHLTIYTRIALEPNNYQYQQFGRHVFRWQFLSWLTRL